MAERNVKPARRGTPGLVLLAVIACVALLVGILGVVQARRQGYGLRSYLRALPAWGRALLESPAVRASSQGEFTNVFFLHHSVGNNLVEQGRVREILSQAGLDLWDQGYNADGLRNPQGERAGFYYAVPGDNTDPDGLARIFSQPVRPYPTNTLSGLLQHEVIVFKSCFPASNIEDAGELAQYKAWYLQMRAVMDTRPDRLFIVLSPPPLNPAETTPAAASNARSFADWLNSTEFANDQHPNVYVFDLFDRLAASTEAETEANMLRADYREGADSHPTLKANESVGPALAEFIIQATQEYRSLIAGLEK